VSFRHEAAEILNGDVVTLGIEGLGEQRQEIIAA
jgi:2-keto-4-pentenoate hydratase/2-oxohepta-3-ene-1,7-dioic acid hydratase in catechol pathway